MTYVDRTANKKSKKGNFTAIHNKEKIIESIMKKKSRTKQKPLILFKNIQNKSYFVNRTFEKNSGSILRTLNNYDVYATIILHVELSAINEGEKKNL